ncbi:MAG: transcriptional regulator [Chromatiales bacterium]|nr:transcriptional regulator [Chromatiales bacterium]
MHELSSEKLITIITTDVLEDRLITIVKAHGASGYTIQRARGGGSSGEQSGMLDVDTNITFHVVLPPDRLSGVLADLHRLIRKHYHLTVWVSDVSVLRPEKFSDPLA